MTYNLTKIRNDIAAYRRRFSSAWQRMFGTLWDEDKARLSLSAFLLDNGLAKPDDFTAEYKAYRRKMLAVKRMIEK